MMHPQGVPHMIFATGFPFSVLVAQLVVTFLNLIRVLLLLMSIFILKLSHFFRVWEFTLCPAILEVYWRLHWSFNQRNAFVQIKVNNWVKHVCVFNDIAAVQPQLAYVAVARSLQHEWTFLLKVLWDCVALFWDLEFTLTSSLLPAIFGVEVSLGEHDLLFPLQMGGLGISNPMHVYCFPLLFFINPLNYIACYFYHWSFCI